jgi:hypothetical protein
MADSSKTGNSNCRCLDLAASPPNSPGPPGILIVAGREKSLSLYRADQEDPYGLCCSALIGLSRRQRQTGCDIILV